MVVPHTRSASHTPRISPRQSNTPRESTSSDQNASPTQQASGNDTPLTEAPPSSMPQSRNETQDVLAQQPKPCVLQQPSLAPPAPRPAPKQRLKLPQRPRMNPTERATEPAGETKKLVHLTSLTHQPQSVWPHKGAHPAGTAMPISNKQIPPVKVNTTTNMLASCRWASMP